jgi:hypothetical protein
MFIPYQARRTLSLAMDLDKLRFELKHGTYCGELDRVQRIHDLTQKELDRRGYKMPKSDIFDVAVKLIHETEKAYLVTADEKEKVWFPKSMCELEENQDGTYTLTAKTFMLKEKGLI